jgi:hypothetical protein
MNGSVEIEQDKSYSPYGAKFVRHTAVIFISIISKSWL